MSAGSEALRRIIKAMSEKPGWPLSSYIDQLPDAEYGEVWPAIEKAIRNRGKDPRSVGVSGDGFSIMFPGNEQLAVLDEAAMFLEMQSGEPSDILPKSNIIPFKPKGRR